MAAATAFRRSSRPMPFDASASGLAWMRTAYFCAPNTLTCATPESCEMRCAMSVSAYSSTTESGSVADESAANSTGWSAGLTFWNDGGVVISTGSLRAAVVSADCTSSAAPSMLRSRSNCSVIWTKPSALADVIWVRPGI